MSAVLVTQLEQSQVDELLQYVPAYSDKSFDNILKKSLKKIHAQDSPRQSRYSFRMLLVAAIATVLLTITALAATGIIDIAEIFKMAFGDKGEYMSQYGTVIESGNTYDGIKLTILSAIKDEARMYVFFSFTDTTGDRLSNKLDLYNSWSLDESGGGNFRMVNYDEATKTANMMITSVGASTNSIETLTIKRFFSGREIRTGLLENVSIYDTLVSHEANIMAPGEETIFGSGFDLEPVGGFRAYEDSVKLLQKDEVNVPFENIKWAHISNVGIVDGQLHMQVNPDNQTANEIITIYFRDVAGNVQYTSNINLGFGEGFKGIVGDYNEFIFKDISGMEQIKDLMLTLDVFEYGPLYEGDWEAKFKVPPQMDTIQVPVDKNIPMGDENVYIKELALSPMGVTIRYKTASDTSSNYENTAFVTYLDGEMMEFDMVSVGNDSGNITTIFSGNVVEIEKVKSITINQQEIPIS